MKYFILPFMVLFLCVSFSVEGQSGYSDPYVNTGGSTSSKRSTRSKRSARSARSKRSARAGTNRSKRKSRGRSGATENQEEGATTTAPRSGRRSARSGRGGTSGSATTQPTTGGRSVRSGRRSARSGRGGTVTSNQTQAPAHSARRARGGISPSQSVQTSARSASVLNPSEVPMIAPSAGDLTTSGQMYAQPGDGADKEEQLLTMEAGKERFQACMDDFCNDTESVNPAGRCLCSANIAKLSPLEDSVHKKMKQLFQMTSNVEATKLGMQYELFNESTLEKMGITDDEDEENPWDLDNVDYGLDALLEGDSKRKEGLALFKDAMSACKPYLDATSSFKKYIVDAYEASAQKSCRGYENLLTNKLRRADLAMQATYNKIQKTEQKTINAYDSSKCSQKLHACMVEEAGCGEGFRDCATRERLEERKLYCKGETLDKCQSVADSVWEDFVRNAIRIGGGSIDEQSGMCARNLQACFEEGGYCGEDNLDCATAAMMEDKKALCYDAIAPCNEKAKSIWSSFVNSVVSKGSVAKAALDKQARQKDTAASQVAYQQCAKDFQSCALPKCGRNGVDCRTSAMAESVRGLCASTLVPCGEKADSLWNAFKNGVMAKGTAYQKQLDDRKLASAKTEADKRRIAEEAQKRREKEKSLDAEAKRKQQALNAEAKRKCLSEGGRFSNGYCRKANASNPASLCPSGQVKINGRCQRALISPAPSRFVTVKYGSPVCSTTAAYSSCSKWKTKRFTEGQTVRCSSSSFGGDPARYVKKRCEINGIVVANENGSFKVSSSPRSTPIVCLRGYTLRGGRCVRNYTYSGGGGGSAPYRLEERSFSPSHAM